MTYEFKATRRVEFSDTDMAGIVHFSTFFRYFETVEHAFFRSLGFSVVMPNRVPAIGFPRVHASCDYRRPLRFEDIVQLHLVVAEKKRKSLTYLIRISRIEPGPVEEVAVGKLVVVCASKTAEGGMRSVEIPEELAAQIQVAPPELLVTEPGARPSSAATQSESQ